MEDTLKLSKFAIKYKISATKLISFLIQKSLIIEDTHTDILHLKSIKVFDIEESTNDLIVVKEKALLKYIKPFMERLILKESEYTTFTLINNLDILREKVREASTKKIMYLDFEYKNGNFYEIAFLITKDNEILKEKYYFVEEEYMNEKKVQKLKESGFTFKVLHRDSIVNILIEAIEEVDYIIAHNSYGERACLKQNEIRLPKDKFICTSDLTKKLHGLAKLPSLGDSMKLEKCVFDHHLHHLSIVDVKMTKDLFESLIK